MTTKNEQKEGKNQPIAVIGMGCRFPGASSPGRRLRGSGRGGQGGGGADRRAWRGQAGHCTRRIINYDTG